MRVIGHSNRKIKYLDLFAGAGGLSEGFWRAGYKPIAHVEMDVAACFSLKTRVAYHWLQENQQLGIYQEYLEQKISRDTFYNMIPQKVLSSVLNYEISNDSLDDIFTDIDRILQGEHLDLIIGGPPCQAYSIAGRSRVENKMVGDNRNYLYRLYAKFLKKYTPKYFVFENVVGLLSAKDEDGSFHFDNMRELFMEYGYNTEFRVLNALDYGVLQNRKRIILIGSRLGDQGFYPDIPKVAIKYKVNELFNAILKIESIASDVARILKLKSDL